MTKITNTTKQSPLNNMVAVAGGVEAQERAGQQELVYSQSLPVQSMNGAREELEQAGVVFGDPYPDDELFCDAQLPDGWEKRATDHDMWSELVDEAGKVRANIFYKAAFYDRKAFLQVAN